MSTQGPELGFHFHLFSLFYELFMLKHVVHWQTTEL